MEYYVLLKQKKLSENLTFFLFFYIKKFSKFKRSNSVFFWNFPKKENICFFI